MFILRKEKLIKIMKRSDTINQTKFLSNLGCAELNYYRLACNNSYSIINKMQVNLNDAQSSLDSSKYL